MFARPVPVLCLLVALALGGCSGTMSFDTLAASVVPAPEQLGGTVMEDPEAVIAKARASDASYGAHGSSGYIVEARGDRKYLLDTGDRLRIFVYGQPNLSRAYIVDADGKVSIPLIGNVKARGLTTRQLEGSIRSRLGQSFVKDPQVTVDVQQNRPFFILGEVRAAGQFPYVNGMTVEMAVAIAGGYGDRANMRTVRVTRRVDGVSEVIEAAPDFELEPGDTVFVHERFL